MLLNNEDIRRMQTCMFAHMHTHTHCLVWSDLTALQVKQNKMSLLCCSASCSPASPLNSRDAANCFAALWSLCALKASVVSQSLTHKTEICFIVTSSLD